MLLETSAKIFFILLMNAFKTLFKVFQLRNYSMKKFNTSIFNVLNAQFSIKIYLLKSLTSALRALIVKK